MDKQQSADRRKLQKELAEHLRDKDRAGLGLLRAQIKSARVERRHMVHVATRAAEATTRSRAQREERAPIQSKPPKSWRNCWRPFRSERTMQKTLVVCSSNRGMQERTRRSIQNLELCGALFSLQAGTADVAFARNQALSFVCELLRGKHPEWTAKDSRDVVLMVDDDMVFTVETARALADYTRKTGHPASAVYCSLGGRIAGATMDQKFEDGVQCWRTGLGLLAIPAALLLQVERDAPKYQHMGQELTAFCCTGVRGTEWIAEDWSLCERLGGVALLPLEAGHLKTVDLWPNQETLDAIARGDALPLHVEPPRLG